MRLSKLIENSKLISKNLKSYKYVNSHNLHGSIDKPAVILGIETSCDDTGIAIVDSSAKILGESLNSQMVYHLK